jgi:hypothetical protein
MRKRRSLVGSLTLLALGACGDGGAGSPEPTYWADVAPILNEKCVRCHQADSAAPFALDGYREVVARAERIVEVTGARTMPPYLMNHDGSCGEFQADETLSDQQIALLARWARGGQQEGTPAPLPRPSPRRLTGGTELQTPTLTPVAQGGQLAEFDEYRCYPVDMGLQSEKFITAYEVTPGNPAIVHHVIGFLVDTRQPAADGRTAAEVMQALDEADPERPGWPCFGMAGEGLPIAAVPVNWAPGIGPVAYPAGTGIPVGRRHQLVVQVHYNLAHAAHRGQTDSTRVRLQFADRVDRQLAFLLNDGFLGTIFGGEPATLAPGQKALSYTWTMKGSAMGLDQVPHAELLGIAPHMHERGISQVVRIGQPGEPLACAANLPRWDFNWQRLYLYAGTPRRLTADTEIEVTCTYDTSRDSSPVRPGWGTRNEMCLPMMMVALPSGS